MTGTIHEDLCIYLLTYSTVESQSREANWFAASQEIPRISRNPKAHYRTHKRPPPVSILDQPNPVHIPTSHLPEIHPNIIHPSTPRSPQWSLSLRFPQQDSIHPSLLTHTRQMPSPYLCTFMKISRCILLRKRNVSDRYCWEKQSTHFIFNEFSFFRKSCLLWDEQIGSIRRGHNWQYNTGLSKIIFGVFTTTQYTWIRCICIFLFNRTTFQIFVTYLIDALYVQRLWFYKHQYDNRVRFKLAACQLWLSIIVLMFVESQS